MRDRDRDRTRDGANERGRPNPFQGLEDLFEQMSRQFETAARSWETNTGSEFGNSFDLSIGESVNGLDLAEGDDEFVVTVDVPGYETDDVEVRLLGSNDVLHIDGERKREHDADDDQFIRRERREHSFSRQVQLPQPVDDEDVSARLNNGVLTVTLGKREPDDSHSIEIE
ncbi:Hsp20/alpha crystallin family protein [Natronoglomus mannanivorans]|uniref:Hsp20/alpha crystallin family protein n=1 Tax=Natronoglomus mannanivorans TaxID=2979990 RepID=A0AAP2YZ78_9EURY|nr:Hsp20/alpha crystallin family protein [Halobacteria archaeon AArc-xg1-1]